MRLWIGGLVLLFATAAASAQVAFTKQFCDADGANCTVAFAPVDPGTELIIRLTADQITPSGPGSLVVQDAAITDPLPPQLEYLSHAISGPSAQWLCTTPAIGQNGTVRCQVGSFPSGPPTTLDIRVRVGAASVTGTYANNATFTGDLVSVFDEHLLFTIPASATFAVTGPAIPTLSETNLLALAFVLAAISVWRVRS